MAEGVFIETHFMYRKILDKWRVIFFSLQLWYCKVPKSVKWLTTRYSQFYLAGKSPKFMICKWNIIGKGSWQRCYEMCSFLPLPQVRFEIHFKYAALQHIEQLSTRYPPPLSNFYLHTALLYFMISPINKQSFTAPGSEIKCHNTDHSKCIYNNSLLIQNVYIERNIEQLYNGSRSLLKGTTHYIVCLEVSHNIDSVHWKENWAIPHWKTKFTLTSHY